MRRHNGGVLDRHPLLLLTIAGLIAGLGACTSGDEATPATTAPSDTAPSDTAPTTTLEAAPAGTTPATDPPATAPPAAPSTAPSTASSTAPSTWEPIGDGPYDVGVATITVDDPAGERPLSVDVWFPLDATAGELPPQQYTLLPGVYYESPAAVAATPDLMATDATFPLVVYSHGSGGLRYIHSSYTEALASHGYVVAAPDHTGNTAVDRLAGNEAPGDLTAYVRPTDVRRVVDAFTDPAHPTAGPWAAQVDGEDIAVTGHSFGGFTAIAGVTGFTNERGTVEPDERIDAIIPIAPASGATLLPDDVISQVDVPMLILVGTDDVTTPVEPNVTRLWDLTVNSPAYRVELVAGEHQTFTDLCAYTRFLPSLPEVPEVVIDAIDAFAAEGCSDGDIDDQRAAELTNTFAVQFLDQIFRDGPTIAANPPDDVLFRSR
jgi:predicted dienelactone hydrolase